MIYETYKRILNNIEEKAPLESGVQALVYMLFCEKIENRDCDIVVIDRMQKKSIFMSYGGISDLAIVDKNFKYEGKDRSGIKLCIEIKAINEKLEKHSQQVIEQLMTYKRAIITNGKTWILYKLSSDINVEGVDDVIEKEIELAITKSELKSCYLKNYYSKKKGDNKGDEIQNEINMLKEQIKIKEACIQNRREKIAKEFDINKISSQPIDIDIDDGYKTLNDELDKIINSISNVIPKEREDNE